MEKKMTKRALQAQETKQKIYRCGAELFRKHGYQNVSVEQIAQAAGVGIGTLYHYYPSKADLYGEVFIRADDFFRAFEDPAVLKQPPKQVLMDYFRQYARLNEGMGAEYVQLLAIPKNREIFESNQDFELILEQLLAGYQQAGKVSLRCTPAQWRAYLMTCARGVIFDWVIHNAPDYDFGARMEFVMGEVLKPLLETQE